jgi:Leucine-rich repeat (LRR) protein
MNGHKRITMYLTKKFLIVLLMLLTASKVSAQSDLLDSLYLDTMDAAISLEQALQNPEDVIKLELKRKKYKTFPKEILQMTNLQYLDLSKNNISEIPAEIAELKSLQFLILSKNKITSLPFQIGELENLMVLNVNQNNLVAIPPQIGRLRKLKTIDLWSNEVSFFPEDLKYLTELNTLDLRSILISDAEQERIKRMLPNATVYFSPYCKCQQ